MPKGKKRASQPKLTPDKYVFIEHRISRNGELLEGEGERIYIDYPGYGASKEGKIWLSFPLDFEINDQLIAIFGKFSSIGGDLGSGASSGLSPIYELPSETNGIKFWEIDSDGTVRLSYKGQYILLKPKEKWRKYATEIIVSPTKKMAVVIKKEITNYGIFEKAKLKKESERMKSRTPIE